MRYISNPRLVAGFWAAWAWVTTFAYWGKTPTQLDPVTRMVPGEHVFAIWALLHLC